MLNTQSKKDSEDALANYTVSSMHVIKEAILSCQKRRIYQQNQAVEFYFFWTVRNEERQMLVSIFLLGENSNIDTNFRGNSLVVSVIAVANKFNAFVDMTGGRSAVLLIP